MQRGMLGSLANDRGAIELSQSKLIHSARHFQGNPKKHSAVNFMPCRRDGMAPI